MGYAVVTHTDADGVASLGLVAYLAGEWPSQVEFAEPYALHEALGKVDRSGAEVVVIADLGVNPESFPKTLQRLRELREAGARVEWYDHHVWEREWIRAAEDAGARVVVDRSTCAAGVIARYFPRRRGDVDGTFVEELASAVCGGDLWKFDHWLSPWYLRLVRRRDRDRWRLEVALEISRGKLWTDRFTRKVEERFDEELRAYSSIRGDLVAALDAVRVVIAKESKALENSFLASYLMARRGASVAVIVGDGGKLSLRSRGVDVRNLAILLGGGGHPNAAGARIRIPAHIKVLSKLFPSVELRYVLSRLRDAYSRLPAPQIPGSNTMAPSAELTTS
ncbi:MAG: DHHA1 domain-containing protein [Desulfurococcaceae archaeon]